MALLDESFNKTSKCGQKDMDGQYWDHSNNYVATCYCHSEFTGKASAKDVFLNPLVHAYQVSAKASCSR